MGNKNNNEQDVKTLQSRLGGQYVMNMLSHFAGVYLMMSLIVAYVSGSILYALILGFVLVFSAYCLVLGQRRARLLSAIIKEHEEK